MTKIKEQISAYNRYYYYKNQAYNIERTRLWRVNNPEKQKLQEKNSYNKKKNNIEFITANRLKSLTWQKENSELYKIRQKKWNSNLPRVMISRVKSRAKQRGLEFNIEESDIYIPTHCPVLGMKLDRSKETKDANPSLDRMDNSKGYIKGNIKVISYRANRLKSDATIEEVEAILKYMKDHIK